MRSFSFFSFAAACCSASFLPSHAAVRRPLPSEVAAPPRAFDPPPSALAASSPDAATDMAGARPRAEARTPGCAAAPRLPLCECSVTELPFVLFDELPVAMIHVRGQ